MSSEGRALLVADLWRRVQEGTGVPWQRYKPMTHPDDILFGSPETEVTGIVTTFTPTMDVLRLGIAQGKNTFFCREAPFYSHGAQVPLTAAYGGQVPSNEVISNDRVYQAKLELISKSNLAIIRFADNWDARKVDGQLEGLTRALGWESFHLGARGSRSPGDGNSISRPSNVYFGLPSTTLESLANAVKRRLRVNGVRVMGDRGAAIRKVALWNGLLSVADVEQILQGLKVDLVVAGDAVEWEAVPYMQDLISAGQTKGFILIGDQASEEPGCKEMAGWLRNLVTEVEIDWLPAGEPFWTLEKAEA